MPVSHDIIALSVDVLQVVDAASKTFLRLLHEPGFITAIVVGIFSFIGILYSNKVQTDNLRHTIKAERERVERRKEIDMESQCLRIREGLASVLSRFQESVILLEWEITRIREGRSLAIGYINIFERSDSYHKNACQMYIQFNNHVNENRLFFPDSKFINSISEQWIEMQKGYKIVNRDILGGDIVPCETKEGEDVLFSQFLADQIGKLRTDPSIVKIPDYVKEI